MQRLLGFVFILILISTLTTSVQALQAAPECLEQADCGEGFACDMEINQCVADDDGESGDGAPAECGDPCEEGFVCDWESGECVEDLGGEDPATDCWSDEECMDGYWCNFGWEANTDDNGEDTGDSEAQGVPQAPEEGGESDDDAEPAEETGDETEGGVAAPSGYCTPIDDETGGGEEVGAESAGGEEVGGDTGDDTGESGSSGSGGCSVSSPGDVDRGLVLLLALAAAFALLFPRAERRGRSL
jgi:MYXO-CTERM domain-containing protein